MRVTITILVVFLLCNCKENGIEDTTNSLVTIKNEQRNTFCAECPDKSLAQYLSTIKRLEKIIFDENNKENFNLNIILANAYSQLALDYYLNDKVKLIEYTQKHINLLENISQKPIDKFNKDLLMRKLGKAYLIQRNYFNINDPKYLFWNNKIKKIYKYFPQSVNNPFNMIIDMPKSAQNDNLSEQDNEMINKLIDLLLNVESQPTHKKSKEIKHNLETLFFLLKSNQLSYKNLIDLSLAVIQLRELPFSKRWTFLDEIIWWCQARSIENKVNQLQFLNNQMLSNRKLDALKMLIELRKVEEIKGWSKKLKFENSEQIFKDALREAVRKS